MLIRQSGSRLDRLRDGLAQRIANFALRHIATRWYRQMIEGSIRYGMEAAARDAQAQKATRQPEGANPDDYSWMEPA